MTAFWLLAATLLVVVLVVLLRPLLRARAPIADDTAASNLRILRAQLDELEAERAAGRLDDEQLAVARTELERRVLEESSVAAVPARAMSGRKSAVALLIGLPLLAIAMYARLGSSDGLDPAIVSAPQGDPHAAGQMDMEQAVQRLADRMKAEPDNPDGWALLGRSYAQMQRFEDARDAYAQAMARKRDDPQLLADYADALAMTQGRNLEGEPEKLVLRALAIDPDHVKALALAGTAAMARRDYANAVKHWTRARGLIPEDNPLAQGLDSGIAEARAAGGMPAAAAVATAPGAGPRAQGPAAPTAAPPAAPAGAGGIRVTVSLAPALAAKVQPGDTLFVFARAAEGPRMPLAIVRMPVPAIDKQPVTVQLDDSSAMSPAMKLSGASRVVVVARVSRQGGAAPVAGDLEGESAPREPKGDIKLVIDRVHP
ncbi:MAG: c-type cytochrome biogenesis protein CcmI [Aquincola sp.]|nr:c-type cytochrome biogenesis protein CcmI [Aquincola sp.]MDH4287963.1 c-type cytochrome biogenesis protein CcmI [Aquincola sp.]MDH5331619.1 c-type cytochrome biogenesis protein CcmI [Aquincola sp.]